MNLIEVLKSRLMHVLHGTYIMKVKTSSETGALEKTTVFWEQRALWSPGTLAELITMETANLMTFQMRSEAL